MKQGFTLIELIIVIIIVGILAALGITQYTKVIEKGRAAEARDVLGSLRAAEVAEMNENGAYAAVANLSVGAPAACAATHYFAYSCDAGTGTCTADRCQGAAGKQPGGTVVYGKTLTVAGVWGFTGAAGY